MKIFIFFLICVNISTLKACINMKFIKKYISLYIIAITLPGTAIPEGTKLPRTEVMKILYKAYSKAKEEQLTQSSIVTVVDYSLPSNQPRLWVMDMSDHSIIKHTTVAHGKYSGQALTTSFSNQEGSLKSSLGVFLTGDTYQGKHGKSMRLKGLEKGFNDNAEKRGIVVHGAKYVHRTCNNAIGMCNGRSFGCPAVSDKEVKAIIENTQAGSLWVSYYPDQQWLTHSDFLA